MADQYTDVNGNPINLSKSSGPPASYTDVHGNPVGSSIQAGLGLNQPGSNPQRGPAVPGPNPAAIPEAAADFLPMAGSFAGPEGTAAGAFIKQALKESFPGTFNWSKNGEPPSAGEAASGVAGDFLGQEVPGRLISAVANPRLTVAKALSNKLVQKVYPQIQNTTGGLQAKALQFPETGILESAASNTDDLAKDFVSKYNSAPDVPSQNKVWGEYQDKIGTNNVGQSLLRLNRDVENGGSVANQQAYKRITNSVLSDVSQVRNFKLATGEDTTVRQLAQNQIVGDAFGGKGSFNPDSILGHLNGPKKEIYQEALGPAYDNLKKLAEQTPGTTGNNLISYLNHRLVFHAALVAGGGLGEIASGHFLGGVAGAGAIILSDKAVTAAMSDPIVAKLVLAAQKTPLGTPQAGFLQKALVNSLKGVEAYSQTPDGIEKVTVGDDGKPQLIRH